MDSKIKETINNQSEKKGVTSKKKKVLFWSLISLAVAIVLVGVIVGVVLLLRNNETPPEKKTPLGSYVEKLEENNITDVNLKREDIVLPDNITNYNIKFINSKYIVANFNGVDYIYVRNQGENEPTLIESFTTSLETIEYSEVKIINDNYAIISNTESESYIVDIDNLLVLHEVTGCDEFTFINGFIVCSGYDNEYMNIVVWDFNTNQKVLEKLSDDKIYSVHPNNSNIIMYGDLRTVIYSYEVVDSKLKQILSEVEYQPVKVDSEYISEDNEFVIVRNGEKFKISEYETTILVTNKYQLIEKITPTNNLDEANHIFRINDDNGIQQMSAIVSHYAKDLDGNYVKDILVNGTLSYIYPNMDLDGYYKLSIDNFVNVDENNDLIGTSNNQFNRVIVNENLDVIFEYDESLYGNVIYLNDEMVITTNGAKSGILDLNGSATDIIDTQVYNIVGSNVWDGKFIVKENAYCGVSDLDGNVVVSPEFLWLSPIINGYMVGNINDYYYLVNLNTNTATWIEDFAEEYYVYTLTGIGVYVTENDGGHDIYNYDGTILYEKVSNLNILQITDTKQEINILFEKNEKVELISVTPIDKYFVESYILNNYVPMQEGVGEPYKKVYDSLVFGDKTSYSVVVESEDDVDQEDSEGDDENPLNITQGSVSSDSGNQSYEAVNTSITDTYYNTLSGGYETDSSKLSKIKSNLNALGNWYDQSCIFNKKGSITSINNKSIPLAPIVFLNGGGKDNAKYFDMTSGYNAYDDFFGKDGGDAFGFGYINNVDNYKDGEPLSIFKADSKNNSSGRANLLKLLPPISDYSTGKINDSKVFSQFASKYDFYIDGVLIEDGYNEVYVLTRILVTSNNGSRSVPEKISTTYTYGAPYTYYLSVGYCSGYTVNNFYAGYVNTLSSSVTKSSNIYVNENNMGNFLSYDSLELGGNGEVISPLGFYLVEGNDDVKNAESGLVVRSVDGIGWRKTLNGSGVICDDYSIQNSEGVILYCRSFCADFKPTEDSGIIINDFISYSDTDIARVEIKNYGPTCNDTFIASTPCAVIAFDVSTYIFDSKTINPFGWYTYEIKDKELKGTYFNVTISKSSGNVKITPKMGFYISSVSGNVYNENAAGTHKDIINLSFSGINTNGEVKSSTAFSGRKYIALSITVKPIVYKLKINGYYYFDGEAIGRTNEDDYSISYRYHAVGHDSDPVISINKDDSTGYDYGSFVYGYTNLNNQREWILKDIDSKYKFGEIADDGTFKGVYDISSLNSDNWSKYYANNKFSTTELSVFDEEFVIKNLNVITNKLMLNNSGGKSGTAITVNYNVSALYEICSATLTMNSDLYQYDSVNKTYNKIDGQVGVVSVYDVDNNKWVRFTENTDEIFNNLQFEIYWGKSILESLRIHANNKKDDTRLSDEAKAFFKYLSNENSKYPCLKASGYSHLPPRDGQDVYQYYYYKLGTNTKQTIYYASQERVYGTKPGDFVYMSGLFIPTEYDVSFNKNDDGGKTNFTLNATNGLDEVFNGVVVSDKMAGNAVTPPNIYTASYNSNKTMSNIQKIKHWVAENGTEIKVEDFTLIAAYDTNLDDVMEFIPVFYSEDETLFNYKVTYSYGGNQITGVNNIDDYISSEIIESVTAKVGDKIEIRLSPIYTKYIKNIKFTIYTGNNRPDGTGNRYERVEFECNIYHNPYIDSVIFDDFKINAYEWNTNDGADNGQSIVKSYSAFGDNYVESIMIDPETQEYVIKIKSTELGRLDTTQYCWLGGVIEIDLTDKIYNGGVEVS